MGIALMNEIHDLVTKQSLVKEKLLLRRFLSGGFKVLKGFYLIFRISRDAI